MAIDPTYNTRPTDDMFVDCVATPLGEEEATWCLREAWIKLFGSAPSINSLAILWGQSALETGRWKILRSYNWGNIKKIAGEKYTSYPCSEIINGKNVSFYSYNPQTFFCSWDTALNGAIGYLSFISQRSRYKKAWIKLQEGNVSGYVIELHNAGYFTADINMYLKTTTKLYDEFLSKKDILLAWQPQTPSTPLPEIPPIPIPPIPDSINTPPITPTNTQPDFFTTIINFLMQILKIKG
jgi:hypothetical protein